MRIMQTEMAEAEIDVRFGHKRASHSQAKFEGADTTEAPALQPGLFKMKSEGTPIHQPRV